METKNKEITVEVKIHAPLDKVWEFWTEPDHIMEWNSASDDWHTPKAENDLRQGGKFHYRMEAKDGSNGFDFVGEYDNIEEKKVINYTLDDDRKVKIEFSQKDDETLVTEVFQPEDMNDIDTQREGWQAILDNFKNYSERVHDLSETQGKWGEE